MIFDEFFLAIPEWGKFIFVPIGLGIGNWKAREITDYKNDLFGKLEAFAVGSMAGLILTFGFAYLIEYLSIFLQAFLWYQFGILGLGLFFGVGTWLIKMDKTRVTNTRRLWWGQFFSDPNRSFSRQVVQLVLRFSWELIQCQLGYGYAHLRNCIGFVDRVELFAGMAYAIRTGARYINGVSLGNLIVVNQRNRGLNMVTDFLPMHEYGHTFQSQIWGPGYLVFIGLPSLYSALFMDNHHERWYEKQTDRYARAYFKRYYGTDYPFFEQP